ncbi:MAG TPA: glutathione S-transferase N-terminal domain-containing protein [Solirubrobacteraceae bacterium]|nr:glutathione S-transferase N-terminal domain-containing protein [Solirubrobacteraceae bacterium]
MKLYVCFGTFKFAPRPGGRHPCGTAYHALVDAGYQPEVVKSYGLAVLPGIFNQTAGRRKVKELTGSHMVPALVTDDGDVVHGSGEIAAWARAHPAAPGAAAALSPGS